MSGVFSRLDFLPLLLLVPALWWSLRRLDRARARRLLRCVGPRVRSLAAELGEDRRRLKRRYLTAGLLLGLLAVLQPRWGMSELNIDRRGVDILVCLDVSRSMLARDLRPDRLTHARREIKQLAESTRGDRLGLVAFAGEARLTVPLTQDTATFAELVDHTDPVTIRRGGTDLGAALETALDALDDQGDQTEVVLLVSDGEDLGESGLEITARFQQRGVPVHCIGIGSPLGSKIALEEDGVQTFLRDRSGADVISVMDAAGLAKLARATGGRFVDGTRGSLTQLYENTIVPMARHAMETDPTRERENRYQWPLALAFFLFLAELALTDRRTG